MTYSRNPSLTKPVAQINDHLVPSQIRVIALPSANWSQYCVIFGVLMGTELTDWSITRQRTWRIKILGILLMQLKKFYNNYSNNNTHGKVSIHVIEILKVLKKYKKKIFFNLLEKSRKYTLQKCSQ